MLWYNKVATDGFSVCRDICTFLTLWEFVVWRLASFLTNVHVSAVAKRIPATVVIYGDCGGSEYLLNTPGMIDYLYLLLAEIRLMLTFVSIHPT